MIVPAGPGSSVLTGPSRGRSLAGSGSPGRPAYFSLLVQWHLDRGQLPVMVRPCSRGISVRTLGQSECGRDSSPWNGGAFREGALCRPAQTQG